MSRAVVNMLSLDLNIRISPEMNSKLNELAGMSDQDRSKIARLALLDMLSGSNQFRKEVMKSIRMKASSGRGIIIQETFI